MRKTLIDLAKYLNCILVPETHEEYEIKPVFERIASAEKIREGVLAFRDFLSRLYNVLEAEGNVYDTSKKEAHKNANRTRLSVYFPFLHNVNTMLEKIGYYGEFVENAGALACDNTIYSDKLSVRKTLESLRFLAQCGICMEGIDLSDTRQNLSVLQPIKVTYPENPAMLVGMKVLAIAEIEHRTLVNQDVLLRCDYRTLKQDKTDALSIVQDTIRPLSADVQDFVLSLHHRYLDKGFTCVVEVKGFYIYIRYCYKRKDVWGINASLNNGYHINVKPVKTQEYTDTVSAFHPYLRAIIAQGYGCGRKRAEIGHCDGGCSGLAIPLDGSVLEMRNDIVSWFDQELSWLQRKK